MDQELKHVFADEIRLLAQAKEGVYKKFEEGGVQMTPTVIDSVRTFGQFLDTAYLWLNQLQYFVMAGGTAPSEDVPEPVQFPGGEDAPASE